MFGIIVLSLLIFLNYYSLLKMSYLLFLVRWWIVPTCNVGLGEKIRVCDALNQNQKPNHKPKRKPAVARLLPTPERLESPHTKTLDYNTNIPDAVREYAAHPMMRTCSSPREEAPSLILLGGSGNPMTMVSLMTWVGNQSFRDESWALCQLCLGCVSQFEPAFITCLVPAVLLPLFGWSRERNVEKSQKQNNNNKKRNH